MAIIYQVEVKSFNESNKDEIEELLLKTDEMTAEQDSNALLFAFEEDGIISTGKITFDNSSLMYDFFTELKNNYGNEFVFFSNKAFKYGKFKAIFPDGIDEDKIIIKKVQGIISYRYRFGSKKERDIFAKKNKLN